MIALHVRQSPLAIPVSSTTVVKESAPLRLVTATVTLSHAVPAEPPPAGPFRLSNVGVGSNLVVCSNESVIASAYVMVATNRAAQIQLIAKPRPPAP